MSLLGFVINPIAGMGGRVGLKGTDELAAEAIRLGAKPVAAARALEALRALNRLLDGAPGSNVIDWLTASGDMGSDALQESNFPAIKVVHTPPVEPSADDTRAAVQKFVGAGVDLVLFCGGDGTARDVCSVTGDTTPILGIPSGVKMYSGVFGVTPARTAELLTRYLTRQIGLADAEIVDLDEERYRRDEWAVRLYMTARTPFEPTYLQTAKAIIVGVGEDAVKEDIAAHLCEEINKEPETLFLLGPGSTVQAIGRALEVEKTILGVDAVAESQLVGKDLNEHQILDLLARYRRCKLVLSPLGAQGFLLGRGNQQLSAAVIRRIGVDNIIVVATPAKLARTPLLRTDTGDSALDADINSRNFLPVVVGYHRLRLVRTAG
jgi:predicted polyphosphate/ATP-dependent NAD kinase